MSAINSTRRTRAFWVRRIRTYRGYTQADIAERIGVSANQISRYERGLDDPSIDVLDRILIALECWYGDLMADITIDVPPRRSMHRPTADVVARAIEIVIAEFAHPSRPPEQYPDEMRCWTCHGRPGECQCNYICKVCGLPVKHGRKCSGKLHRSIRAVPLDRAC